MVLMIAGCGRSSVIPSPMQADLSESDPSILAGEWEYEDGAAMVLRLDQRGNGTYPYMEGRFETTRLQHHTWMGKWYQQENDREGGFVVKLTGDYTEGEGSWWYVRIGTDHAPSEKGGTFRLSRKATLTKPNLTPPVP